MDPTSPQQLGRHLISYLEPDILHFVLNGDVSPEETTVLLMRDREQVVRRGYSLSLLDATHLGRVPLKSRQRSAEIMTSDRQYIGCAAIVGTSPHLRILIGLMVRAVSLVLRTPVQVDFFKTQADALQWLRDRRPELIARAAVPPQPNRP